MSDEVRETEVEVTRVTTETVQAAVDVDRSPAFEESEIVTQESDVVTYYAPRSAWDFTNAQRLILAILLWLNIIVFVVGYLVLTGQLSL